MNAQRDSMTLKGTPSPSLGVEERSDETPSEGGASREVLADPEVVAKPTRRQFTAQYRLRILEESERGAESGHVGRLLRREGLYSSHLSAWRKARREGSLQGSVVEDARREAREAQPPGRQGARARGEGGTPGEGARHRAHDPGGAGKRLKAAAALLYRKKLQRGRRLSDGRGERPSTWSFVLQEVVAEGVS